MKTGTLANTEGTCSGYSQLAISCEEMVSSNTKE